MTVQQLRPKVTLSPAPLPIYTLYHHLLCLLLFLLFFFMRRRCCRKVGPHRLYRPVSSLSTSAGDPIDKSPVFPPSASAVRLYVYFPCSLFFCSTTSREPNSRPSLSFACVMLMVSARLLLLLAGLLFLSLSSGAGQGNGESGDLLCLVKGSLLLLLLLLFVCYKWKGEGIRHAHPNCPF